MLTMQVAQIIVMACQVGASTGSGNNYDYGRAVEKQNMCVLRQTVCVRNKELEKAIRDHKDSDGEMLVNALDVLNCIKDISTK